MLESFYSKDLAIVFNFGSDGVVQGIFTQNSGHASRQEFEGIFHPGVNKSVGFVIDWNQSLAWDYHHYQTAFFGLISDNTLHLDWLHIVDRQSSETGHALLVRDLMKQEMLTHLQGCRPYPLEVVFNVQDN